VEFIERPVMASFQIPDELNDQSWEILAPMFENGQEPPQNWYDAQNQEGKTLLVMAAENGRCREMRIFLSWIRLHNIPINPGNTIHDNLVWISIAGIDAPGGKEFLDCLLKFPNFVRSHAFTAIEGERGQSPIHAAALKGAIDLFKTLEGVDRVGFVNRLKGCVDRDGCTPLDLAIHTGNVDMIRLLMDLYVLPASRDKSGSPRENILHRALKLKTPDLKVVQIILSKYPFLLTAPNQEGKTPLQYISGKQEIKDRVQTSLENDPSPNLSQITSEDSKDAIRQIKEYLVTSLFETRSTYEELRKELGNECLGRSLSCLLHHFMLMSHRKGFVFRHSLHDTADSKLQKLPPEPQQPQNKI
jgi:ankyrin repeat protein